MVLTINNATITERAIAEEAKFHAGSPCPVEDARRALAVRELLLQRAGELGLMAYGTGPANPEREDAVIEALLEREARMPEPTAGECFKYYRSYSGKFRTGEQVEAAHILFAVTATAPMPAIRSQAEATLKLASASPESFGELARRFSNCPSAARGGNLGRLRRGESVPEFEAVVFQGAEIGVLAQLVHSRHGFHVVRVLRRIAGRQLPFGQVKEGIASFLREQGRRNAVRQYLRILAGKARISGVDMAAADSPLLQ